MVDIYTMFLWTAKIMPTLDFVKMVTYHSLSLQMIFLFLQKLLRACPTIKFLSNTGSFQVIKSVKHLLSNSRPTPSIRWNASYPMNFVPKLQLLSGSILVETVSTYKRIEVGYPWIYLRISMNSNRIHAEIIR